MRLWAPLSFDRRRVDGVGEPAWHSGAGGHHRMAVHSLALRLVARRRGALPLGLATAVINAAWRFVAIDSIPKVGAAVGLPPAIAQVLDPQFTRNAPASDAALTRALQLTSESRSRTYNRSS